MKLRIDIHVLLSWKALMAQSATLNTLMNFQDEISIYDVLQLSLSSSSSSLSSQLIFWDGVYSLLSTTWCAYQMNSALWTFFFCIPRFKCVISKMIIYCLNL
jgi:hypothetical protein